MRSLPHVFKKNEEWIKRVKEERPNFFKDLEMQQSPKILWIGCSDSRVPATEICGMDPGEIFVHRNIANVVVYSDFNCLSVIQYAVEMLKVTDIVVCGHYGCGGVKAAMTPGSLGLIDNWLKHIEDVYLANEKKLDSLSEKEKYDLMVELNVREQAINVCKTTVVQGAWERGQELHVHGWVYALGTGKLQDLGVCIANNAELKNLIHG